MGKFKGTRNAAGAIFIYKDESLNDVLWNDLLQDVAEEDPIHVELLTQKDEFLANLKSWNAAQEFISDEDALSDNSYTSPMLLIHAHMGAHGIAPVQKDSSRIISWEELVACFSIPVSLVWLFGCCSDIAKAHWSGKAEILLTCTIEESFRTLVPMFKNEVTMRNIVYFDDMLKNLHQNISTLSYFTYDQEKWTKAFET